MFLAAKPPEQLLLDRWQRPHSRVDDRERITRARQAAEALFAPKRPVTEQSVLNSPPAADPRKARILATSPPTRAPLEVEEAEPPVRLEEQARPEIPVSKFAHIRALVKYGMTVSQVAEVDGVAVGAIGPCFKSGHSPRKP
jgi:hypothetical protein